MPDSRKGSVGTVLLLAAIGGCEAQGAKSPPDLTLEQSPFLAVGAAQSPEHEVFGSIADILPLPGGGVLVLDGSGQVLSWFDADGALVAQAGGAGRGPGEFAIPSGLHLDEDSLVHVLDTRNARISVFRMRDRALHHEGEVVTNLMGNDLCRVGERYIVNAFGDGSALHIVDSTGTLIGSFATMTREIPEAVRGIGWFDRTWQQNRAFLACGSPVAPIVMAHLELPFVRAFDTSGTELWRTRLEGFHPVQWRVLESGAVAEAADPESGRISRVGGVALGPSGTVLVGAYEYWLGTARSYATYVLDAATGEQLARIEAPFIVAGFDDGALYGYVQEPWPRVAAYRLASPERR